MRRVEDIDDLRLGVTYDVATRSGPPFRGRFLNWARESVQGTHLFAMFIVNGEHQTVRTEDFVAAKPVTGSWFRHDQ